MVSKRIRSLWSTSDALTRDPSARCNNCVWWGEPNSNIVQTVAPCYFNPPVSTVVRLRTRAGEPACSHWSPVVGR